MRKLIVMIWPVILLGSLLAEDLQVTVYNNNFALVRDVQSVELEQGKTDFQIKGVSARIDPTSVHLKFEDESQVNILEMNFLYDLVNSAKIFRKYIGKNIIFHLNDGTELQGKLLSYSGGDLIIAENDGSIRINSAKHIRDYKFPQLPGGLIIQPTLEWKIESQVDGQKNAELSYLTDGINWHAEYVLVLAENDQDCSISAWISLENESGAYYENAKVKLIAGDIHRVAKAEARRQIMFSKASRKDAIASREIFDYHLYEIDRLIDIADREVKQIALFDNLIATAAKKYIFKNSSYGGPRESALQVKLFIQNTAANNMGLALPQGKVRMFKKDIDGALQMIGEDRIEHTGKQEEIVLVAGKAFDVKGERSVLNIETYSQEELVKIQIKLFNRTSKTANIEVQEIQRGDWHVKSSNSDYQKKSNNLLIFPVTLEGNQEKTIEYEFVREY